MLTEFPVPASANLSASTTGPDGALWIHRIWRQHDQPHYGGVVTEFPIHGQQRLSATTGRTDALWLPEYFRSAITTTVVR
jgi:hypothetical protein